MISDDLKEEYLEIIPALQLLKKNQIFKVFIDSFGGYTSIGFGIGRAIKLSKGNVITIVTGNCLSAAAVIAIQGHQRWAYRHAHFMIHGIQASIGDYKPILNFERFAKASVDDENQLKLVLKENSKLPKKIMEDIFEKNLEFHANAKKALEYGLIDKIL